MAKKIVVGKAEGIEELAKILGIDLEDDDKREKEPPFAEAVTKLGAALANSLLDLIENGYESEEMSTQSKLFMKILDFMMAASK